MKTINRIIIFLLALGASVSAVAQGPSLSEERQLNLKAFRLMEAYKTFSTLRNNDAEAQFRQLFRDDDVMLYNDLLGLSKEPELNIDNYIALMHSKVRGPLVAVKNVRKKGIADGGDKWLMTVTFDKEMRYNTDCGAILSSTAYYGADYAMEAVIASDKADGRTYIVELRGSIDSAKPRLGDDFMLVQRNDPRDSDVSNNGEKIQFNTFDQAFVTPPYNFKYYDADANMKVEKADPNSQCNVYEFTYHPLRWRLKPHIDLSLGSPYSISDKYSGLNTTMSNMEFGLDIGYVIPSKSNFKVGINLGVGMSTGKIGLDIANLNYNYNAPAAADVDGETYQRYYELSGLHQDVKLQHLFVPLYFDFELRFHSYVSAYLRLGAKAYFDMGSKTDGFSGNSTAYGVYSIYDNLVMTSDINNFGTEALTEAMVEKAEFNSLSFAALGGAGVRVKIVGPLSLEAGVTYQMGITDVMKPKNGNLLASGSIAPGNALVTYTVANGTQARNLANMVGNIKHNSINLNIGLILKF